MLKIINESTLFQNDELEIFQALLNKYDFGNIKYYSDKKGISVQRVHQLIELKKIQLIEKNGLKMCF
jgi:hypothetical protein